MDFKEYSIGEFDTEEQKKFRQEVRDWFGKNISPELVQEAKELRITAEIPGAKELASKLGAKGWLVPEWPKEYGGAGLSVEHRYILAEEVAVRVPGLQLDLRGGIVGQTVLRHGTEEQKRYWLPKIAMGENACLGYTEPNAGTDLASLQMRAVSDGDDYIVNGQKIFSTGAHRSKYHWLAVRTNVDVPKHRGISVLIVDLKSPGITIKPLTTIAGERTNEVFYDNVRVPKKNRIGPEDGGWSLLRGALTIERSHLGARSFPKEMTYQLIQYAKETERNGRPLSEDPFVRQSLAQLAIEVSILRLYSLRVGWLADKGISPDWAGAMSKIWEAELSQRVVDSGMRMLGLYGQLEPGSKWVQLKGDVEKAYQGMVVRSFGGGSDEILRGVIATRGMGLPREPQLVMPKK